MNGEGSDRLIARIDAALMRINAACDHLPATDDDLRQRHQNLRGAVTTTLDQLDKLIAQQENVVP